jgi:hypothetical protein
VTKRAALLWMFSNALILLWLVGSHTVDEHSMVGLTIVSLTVLVQSFKFLLINPRVLFPLAATLSTCLSQDKLLVKVTPRYLLESTISSVWP